MEEELSFGVWLRKQRRALDLSRQAFADMVGCAEVTLRRIEAGTLKPSTELASVLLAKIGIPEAEQQQWIAFARGLSGFPPLATSSSDEPNSNLPIPLTTFIGREKEQSDLMGLIAKHRLVTLTGSGGVGKTRLAIKVVADVAKQFPDGVWFVDLAPLNDPELVPNTLAALLGLQESKDLSTTTVLINYFRPRTALVIFDNCEHLVEACGQLVYSLLTSCENLSILATGREALRISGETPYRVPSLAIPALEFEPATDTLRKSESVRLFAERAAAVTQDFVLEASDTFTVAQICHRLDGIPLAIELAAARVNVLPVEKILSRLTDRFHLLKSSSRVTVPRHQTLRATIEWSYDLLAEPERSLLRRLSVFVGGFSLKAAEAICVAEGLKQEDVLEHLQGLVDKSLVNVEHGNSAGDTRYRLLETIRQYSLEKLGEAGEGSPTRTQHLEFFVQLAEQAKAELHASNQDIALRELDAEYGNLRAALEWAMNSNPVRALQLTTFMGRFWEARGYIREGRIAIEKSLQQAPDAPKELRAIGLYYVSGFADREGDYAKAKASIEESLQLSRETEDKESIVSALLALANVVWVQGDFVAARASYEEIIALYQELGDKHGVAVALTNLGNAVIRTGDYVAARRYEEESVAIFRDLGDYMSLVMALNNLGVVAEEQGDRDAARRFYEESISIARQLREKTFIVYSLNGLAHVLCLQGDLTNAWRYYRESLILAQHTAEKRMIAYGLEGLAKVALRQGMMETAARLLGAADALRRELGAPLDPAEQTELDQDVIAIRNRLPEKEFAVVWSKGSRMTLEQSLTYALEELKGESDD
jgi:predicted ATPase/Tfp pilus assembly protein PilF/DNA-binding XRE family transcriptional regulator